MESDRVEVIRQMVAAWNRRDLDAILSLTAPDAEYVNAPEALESGTRHGHDQISEAFRRQWEGLGDSQQEIGRCHDRGDEIVTENRLIRTLPGSETLMENRVLLSWTIRGGRVVRMKVLGAGSSFQRALQDAGLSE